MPKPAGQPAARSALARVRVRHHASQGELAAATGLSVRTIQRLERKELDNPSLRHLVNCALALRVPLDEVIDEDWKQWKVFDVAASQPPPAGWTDDPSSHWNLSPYSAVRTRGQKR